MSRSCHSATFSSAAARSPRITRASPLTRSHTTGFRLCGMAHEPFWPSANGSCTSRTSVRARCRISVAIASSVEATTASAVDELRVAVALDHLGRGLGGPQPEPGAHELLHARIDGGVGADHAADRADADGLARAAQALAVAVQLERPHRELVAERRRLGVDAVRAPDASTCRGAASARRFTTAEQRSSRASSRSAARAELQRRSPVSSTSEDVRPKWIQRPSGPIDSATTSTNAATSWRVTRFDARAPAPP